MGIVIIPLREALFEGSPEEAAYVRFKRRTQLLQEMLIPELSRVSCVVGPSPSAVGNMVNILRKRTLVHSPAAVYTLGLRNLEIRIQSPFELVGIDRTHHERHGDFLEDHIPWFADISIFGDVGNQAGIAAEQMIEHNHTAAIFLGELTSRKKLNIFQQMLGVMFHCLSKAKGSFHHGVNVTLIKMEDLPPTLRQDPSQWPNQQIPILG